MVWTQEASIWRARAYTMPADVGTREHPFRRTRTYWADALQELRPVCSRTIESDSASPSSRSRMPRSDGGHSASTGVSASVRRRRAKSTPAWIRTVKFNEINGEKHFVRINSFVQAWHTARTRISLQAEH